IKEFDPSRVGPNQDPKAAMKDLTANVKDKPACVAEIMAWMESKSPNKEQSGTGMDELASATIEDVKIDGDSATATVKAKNAGQEKSNPAKFKKIDSVWYVDLAGLLPGTPN